MFNKNLINKNMIIKKTFMMTTIASLFLVGCGSDQSYKREVDGNQDYLDSPALKPLIVPEGVTIPAETIDFYIYSNKIEGGAVGKQVDVRPPVIPIPTISDSYASYNHGVVTLNVPDSNDVWSIIPSTLSKRNIPISSNNTKEIVTSNASIYPEDEGLSIQASYIIQRETHAGSEIITVGLKNLSKAGQDISSDPIEVQRYVVRLFNFIMDDAAPESSRIVSQKAEKDGVKNENTDKDPELSDR